MNMSDSKPIPIVWLPWKYKKKLFKDFYKYVISCIKFKHYVMLFSLIALSYQTNKLVSTYLEYQTVVKVEIVKPFVVDIPGTTVCTDKYHIILKSKLEAKYPELKSEVKRMRIEMENTNASDVDIESETIELYRRYREMARQQLTLGDYFALTVDPNDVFECELWLKPIYHTKRNLRPTCADISKPLYHFPYGAGLCWTYFSQVNPNDYHKSKDRPDWYRVDVQEEGRIASFKIRFDIYKDFVYDEMPYTVDNEEKKNEFYVVVHHPKMLPYSISLDRAVVRNATKFDIYFSQTNARLLRWPFSTDCVEYEIDSGFDKFKSSHHCIDECLSEKAMRECGCIFNESNSGRTTKCSEPYLGYRFCQNERELRDDEAWDESTSRNCSHRYNYETYNTDCNQKGRCNQNCLEEYYRYEVKQGLIDDEDEGNSSMTDLGNQIDEWTRVFSNSSYGVTTIVRRDSADVTYEHTSEMIFVEFICYFGGLLGLWLGVSVLDVYAQLLVWWDVVPVEYRKWLEQQAELTKVESFKSESNGIAVISNNYNSQTDYGVSRNRDSIYDTKY